MFSILDMASPNVADYVIFWGLYYIIPAALVISATVWVILKIINRKKEQNEK